MRPILQFVAVLIFTMTALNGSACANHFEKYRKEIPPVLAAVLREARIALGSGDGAKMFDVLPPGIVDIIAKQSNMTVEELKKSWSKPVSDKAVSQTFDFERDIAYELPLKSGRQIFLFPSLHTIVESDDKKTLIQFFTLAFQDQGRWRLVMMEDEVSYGTLVKAYPDFNDEMIPQAERHGYATWYN